MSFNVYYECKIPCENEEIVVRAGTPAAGNDGRKWPAHGVHSSTPHTLPTCLLRIAMFTITVANAVR